MSKSAKNLMQNSFLQTSGAVIVVTLNLVLTLGYARILGPAALGELITAQAHVLLWVFFVDLGLSNALISTLTTGASPHPDFGDRQAFRAHDIVWRVLWLRFAGAALASIGVLVLCAARLFTETKRESVVAEISAIPFLFTIAIQLTALAYANFRSRQGLAVLALIGGTLISVAIPLMLANANASVPLLLFTQSWGGMIVGIIVLIGLRLEPRQWQSTRKRNSGFVRGPWNVNAWRALGRDAWPYALAFAAVVLWQRLDQIAASNILGFDYGGQYAVVVRVAAIPLLLATALNQAIFPDLQRLGRQAPELVGTYISASMKLVFRNGFFCVGFLLLAIQICIGPLLPKFHEGLIILPWFLPGIWFFWLQSTLISGLFALRRFRIVLTAYAAAVLAYSVCLGPFTHWWGLIGVALAFSVFPIVLFLAAWTQAVQTKIIFRQALWSDYRKEEEEALKPLLHRWHRLKHAVFRGSAVNGDNNKRKN